MLRAMVSVALLAFCVAPVWAEDVDNPVYKSWKAVPKGTTVTLKTTSEIGGQKNETVVVYTLKELTDDTAKVEMVTTVKAAGQEIKGPPINIDHKKTFTTPGGQPKVDGTKPKVEPAAPVEEKMKIGDKEYTVKKTIVKTKVGDTETESSIWMCDEVPGMVVKSVTKTTGAFSVNTTTELMEIKKP